MAGFGRLHVTRHHPTFRPFDPTSHPTSPDTEVFSMSGKLYIGDRDVTIP